MVDFNKLMGSRALPPDPDPLKIFAALDRKASHADLRRAQEVALGELFTRRAERDLVLKMPTGLGKSTVGLLYLQSHIVSSGRGAVYLCPTVQLAKQILQEAEKLGLKAHEYPGRQPHPHPDCSGGRAVTVCTYDKLFNARTTFGRSDVQFIPHAIVCDDAHSGIEEVRDAFTLRIPAGPAYDALRALVAGPCATHQPGVWEDILADQPGVAVEVPYWSWAALVEIARAQLNQFGSTDSFKFVWPRLRDRLEQSRVIVAANVIEISPLLPLVEEVGPYAGAAHRLFMSATLADDSALVRQLGCAEGAALQPVRVGAENPPGERLVVAPTLIDQRLDRRWLIGWAATAALHHAVVVLCPSEAASKDWVSAGATLGKGSSVEDVVERLRKGTTRFACFMQRYDGIDLPDEACRVLILDGMPFGQNATDMLESIRARTVSGPRNKLVYRIEQGMGRAVRSPADYAVVVLAGPELAAYVSNVDVKRYFGRDLQLQLDVVHEIAGSASAEASSQPEQAFEDLASKLLRRDASWRRYYDDRVRARLAEHVVSVDEDGVRSAAGERRAFHQAIDGDPAGACSSMTAVISRASSAPVRAALLEAKARYQHALDSGEALKIQAAAYAASRTVLRPPVGVAARPARNEEVAVRLLDHVRSYSSMNGLVAAYDALRSELSFNLPHTRFEALFHDLGSFLGADSSRPEHELGEGPDNLWLWTGLSLVVEVKNMAQYERIPKKDAEQLLHSMEWFRVEYPHGVAPTPLFIGPAVAAEEGVHPPPGARVITPTLLGKLLGEAAALVAAIASKPVGDWTSADIAALLVARGLNSGEFVQRFTKQLRP